MISISLIEQLSGKVLKQILSLEKKCFARPYQESNLLNDRSGKIFALFLEGKIISYCYFSQVGEDYELYRIATDPDYQGEGFAKCLLINALQRLKDFNKIYLEVDARNTHALSLYRKVGFMVYRIRKDYYGSGYDAMLMELKNDDFKYCYEDLL